MGAIRSASEPSIPSEQPTEQAQSDKRHMNKRLFIIVAAIAAIIIIVAAVLLVPQSSADVIPLGVDYSVGEKLTYDVTLSLSVEIGGTSMSMDTDSTLVLEVLSFDNEIYTLNYTNIVPYGDQINITSTILKVKENEMITVLALLPAGIQAPSAEDQTEDSPLFIAAFDQSQAKVGDTWQIPMGTEESDPDPTDMITITFNAIQDLTVKAGSFKVFSLDFSCLGNVTAEGMIPQLADCTGQAYLEHGTCKQIQANLQMTLSALSNENQKTVISVSSTLTQDLKP